MVSPSIHDQTDVMGDFKDLEQSPDQIIEYAEQQFFEADRRMWSVCYAASLIVGQYTDQTGVMAGRLGVTVDTIQFYAKAERVRQYVKDEQVYCSLTPTGVAFAEQICKELTFTHYGMIHSKVFLSKRTERGMEYTPIMTAQDALAWLAECVEPLAHEGKRLSPQALLVLMSASPDPVQWFEVWTSLADRLQDYVLMYSEYLLPALRKQLQKIVNRDWAKMQLEQLGVDTCPNCEGDMDRYLVHSENQPPKKIKLCSNCEHEMVDG